MLPFGKLWLGAELYRASMSVVTIMSNCWWGGQTDQGNDGSPVQAFHHSYCTMSTFSCCVHSNDFVPINGWSEGLSEDICLIVVGNLRRITNLALSRRCATGVCCCHVVSQVAWTINTISHPEAAGCQNRSTTHKPGPLTVVPVAFAKREWGRGGCVAPLPVLHASTSRRCASSLLYVSTEDTIACRSSRVRLASSITEEVMVQVVPSPPQTPQMSRFPWSQQIPARTYIA
eukprot:evm.model.scf_4279.1 EVM.evm.TU.scf_4279.1   scf_4279:467-1159(+)